MTPVIVCALFWAVFATVFACVEIESEGKHGWAERMPTWFRTRALWSRIVGLFIGGKPVTGYHAFMFTVPAFVFHAGFVMGAPWSPEAEFRALAIYFAWFVCWDYHWFVLNPFYAGKFRRENVWWHAKSYWVFGRFPVDYLGAVAISLALAGIAAWFAGSRTPFVEHLMILTVFMIETAALHLVAPLYRRWYAQMRLSDDRDQTGIPRD